MQGAIILIYLWIRYFGPCVESDGRSWKSYAFFNLFMNLTYLTHWCPNSLSMDTTFHLKLQKLLVTNGLIEKKIIVPVLSWMLHVKNQQNCCLPHHLGYSQPGTHHCTIWCQAQFWATPLPWGLYTQSTTDDENAKNKWRAIRPNPFWRYFMLYMLLQMTVSWKRCIDSTACLTRWCPVWAFVRNSRF